MRGGGKAIVQAQRLRVAGVPIASSALMRCHFQYPRFSIPTDARTKAAAAADTNRAAVADDTSAEDRVEARRDPDSRGGHNPPDPPSRPPSRHGPAAGR